MRGPGPAESKLHPFFPETLLQHSVCGTNEQLIPFECHTRLSTVFGEPRDEASDCTCTCIHVASLGQCG